jgi:hypothetical protein
MRVREVKERQLKLCFDGHMRMAHGGTGRGVRLRAAGTIKLSVHVFHAGMGREVVEPS